MNNNLPLNSFIIAKKPECPCRGGGFTQVQGTIQKIISNQSGTWYYLSSGSTINADWIISSQTPNQ
ncbi:MAG: hypothetical protein EO766_12380 [Hydrotalea sp. AMD]|uniref:hypothetical protein n=1 Tax=Hydrotalea sp. AMD TaxID=2501297 RepID=UPI0010284C4C|nr:hypothetical protein [Hydrotalea sp. AMD]RWZ87315.1 MAG: hypothetical protein EO766_12380 [Hydrotalea sp. AMD]